MTTWAPHCPPDAVERFKQLDPASQILADTLGEIEIVCLGQEIVGALHRIAHTLKDIHVAPKFQRRGIGTAMMDYAEARGVTRLEVRAFNRGAIAFYEERGWVRVDSFDATEMGAPAVTYEYRRQ
ncbi:MAG: GNAT family N-acetyltransferase [Hyphomicrobiales bacterium]|nr:GNAT family N-acetyltransferase [Hyphomicrobiales bacterium]